MRQRTCNIIACCKGNYGLEKRDVDPENRPWANAVAGYMADECGCPAEDYTGKLLEQILSEALLDYLDTADKPSHDLRRLFDWPGMKSEPSMSERIASVFALVSVRRNGSDLVNGFTEERLKNMRKALNCPGAMLKRGDTV